MAFPTIAATVTSQVSASSTSHTVSLPTGISSGDLLVVFFGLANNVATVSWPAGWTELIDVGSPGGGSPRGSIAFRRADGTEGASITVTSSAAAPSCHLSYRITGHHTTSDPEAASATSAGTANPDPPNLDPAGWAAEDTLWVAAYVWKDSNATHTSYPTSYTLSQISILGTAASVDRVGTAMAGRELNAASENPGTATISASNPWVAITLAVRPAAGAAEGWAHLLSQSRNRLVVEY